jgi:hypothetical protein
VPAWLKPILPSLSKAGPWALLFAALLGWTLVKTDRVDAVGVKVDNLAGTIQTHQEQHDREQQTVIALLRLVCSGVAKTDEGRRACDVVGK